MRLDITGRHVDITPALRQLIDKRLVRLGKLLNDSVISAQVILSKEKYRLQSEIVVHARGDRTLRGNGEDTTWVNAVRQASAKIEQQAHKVKGKWAERKRRAASPRAVTEADAATVEEDDIEPLLDAVEQPRSTAPSPSTVNEGIVYRVMVKTSSTW